MKAEMMPCYTISNYSKKRTQLSSRNIATKCGALIAVMFFEKTCI